MTRDKNSKAFAQQKRLRRQWITFLRMCRYGVSNFSRNAWLTVAATAVMVITLLIIFVTVVAQNVLTHTVDQIGKSVDMSIYLKGDTPNAEAEKIAARLRGLSNTTKVTYINADQNRKEFAEQNKDDAKTLTALGVATNEFFGTLRVSLKDINNTSELDAFIKSDEGLKKYIDSKRKPSFAGPRRDAIKAIAKATDFAQKFGVGASIIFVAISSLIVFNTIRMAIFNRRDEIEMMKLIGADKGFIRGPFVVEAIVYGFVAGVIAAALGLLILQLAQPGLSKAGVAVQPITDFLMLYSPLFVIVMVALGAFVGAVSSLLATQRYLKI